MPTPPPGPLVPPPPLLNPYGNTGSASASQQGYTTSGPAQAGQSGSLNVPPGEPGTGGGGGGGGGGAPIDWAQVYFGNYGLPPDLIGQIEALGRQYGTTNPDVFFQSAQNLIRGSDWFKATYPGFAAGVRAGLFGDESGYRGYVNSLNQVYQQYMGRAVSGDETAAALGQGVTPDLIGRQFQGDVIANVNSPQWQYVTGAFDTGQLTAAEKTALGREQAGIDSPLGQMVAKRVQQAMGRAQTLFGGTIATPSLSLAGGRLAAPSLGTGTSDIAA